MELIGLLLGIGIWLDFTTDGRPRVEEAILVTYRLKMEAGVATRQFSKKILGVSSKRSMVDIKVGRNLIASRALTLGYLLS